MDGEYDLLPGLADVEQVDTVSTTRVDVQSHLLVGILGADLRVGSKKERDLLLADVQWIWES